MTGGIRAQILFALAAVVGFGSLASYLVTSDLMRTTVIEAQVRQARQVAVLAAERLAQVPDEGLATAEALAQIRAVLGDGLLFLVDDGFEPVVDPPSERERVSALLSRDELVILRHETVRHRLTRTSGGSPVVVAVAPIAESEDAFGRTGEGQPVAACVVWPLGPTLALVDTVDNLFLLFTGIIVVLSLILGFVLLGRMVLSPMNRLMRLITTIEEAGLGRYSRHSSGPRPSGEFGLLHDRFNHLAEQLAEERRRIQRQLGELERANREIEAAQAQLVMTEKLATVGQLAAGVAHEIGNPISIVQGYLEILRDMAEDDAQREIVQVMDTAVDRIATIIRDLLDYARPGRDDVAFCDAVQVVHTTAKLVRPQKRFSGLDLRLGEPAEPIVAAAHAGRLEQVVLNLLLNAADASPAGGSVLVSVRAAERKVIVTVSDEGPGVERGDMVRIFDPFYSTKDPGQGTGLGLAICHSIAHSYGGTVAVRDAEGQGASFSVILPQAQG